MGQAARHDGAPRGTADGSGCEMTGHCDTLRPQQQTGRGHKVKTSEEQILVICEDEDHVGMHMARRVVRSGYDECTAEDERGHLHGVCWRTASAARPSSKRDRALSSRYFRRGLPASLYYGAACT